MYNESMKPQIWSYKTASLMLRTDKKHKHAVITDVIAFERRKGHGGELFKRVMKHCDKRKLVVILEALPDDRIISMKNLVRFYEKNGFEIIGNMWYPIMMIRYPKK